MFYLDETSTAHTAVRVALNARLDSRKASSNSGLANSYRTPLTYLRTASITESRRWTSGNVDERVGRLNRDPSMTPAVQHHGRRRPAQPETEDVLESNRAVRRRMIQPDAEPLFDVTNQIF